MSGIGNTLKIKWKWPKLLRVANPFVLIWKKFIRQIPYEYRLHLRSYQHFIVLGPDSSGKSSLIQNFLQSNEDLYPFATRYTEKSQIQFYLGPKQIIQEISFETLENQNVETKKQLTLLWQKLFTHKEPIVLILYDGLKNSTIDFQKWAQIVAGKISLLTEIMQKPLNVQIVLTHMDAVDGYIEFAKFLKEHQIRFTLNTDPKIYQQFFETHSSLLIQSVSAQGYTKIFSFFEKMPFIFPKIEKFIRDLMGFTVHKERIQISQISFFSANEEANGKRPPFDSVVRPRNGLFFKHPAVKHFFLSVSLFVIIFSFLIRSYVYSRNDLKRVEQGITLLERFQTTHFCDQILPQFKKTKTWVVPYFFEQKCKEKRLKFADLLWNTLIEPNAFKSYLEPNQEYKYLYFLGLKFAQKNNLLGKLIASEPKKWDEVLHQNEGLIQLYVASIGRKKGLLETHLPKIFDHPLTNIDRWIHFFKEFKSAVELPIIERNHYQEMMSKAQEFLSAIKCMREDANLYVIASLLKQEQGLQDNVVQTIEWIRGNIDALEHFFLSLKNSEMNLNELQDMGLSQLFSKINTMLKVLESDLAPQTFIFPNQVITLNPNSWNKLVILQNIEEMLEHYMTLNAERNSTPQYSKEYYDEKIRSVTEKFIALLDPLCISKQNKQKFFNFLAKETSFYLNNYQKFLVQSYNTFNMHGESIEELKKEVENLTAGTSSFYDFLQFIQKNSQILNPNIFTFLNPLKTNEYQELMGELLIALDREQLSFELCDSYHQRTTLLLCKNGIPETFHTPFLQPIVCMQELAAQKMRSSIYLQWGTKWKTRLETLFAQIPFNIAGETTAECNEIEALLHPRSECYKLIKEATKAFGYKSEESIQWMKAQFDKALKFSSLLWDENGDPKPLKLAIQTIPFKAETTNDWIPIMSYLIAGDQIIHNRNQMPSWQIVSLEWWKNEQYSIGIELLHKKSKHKTVRNGPSLKGHWGFFNLLKQGKQVEDSVWFWELPHVVGFRLNLEGCFDHE